MKNKKLLYCLVGLVVVLLLVYFIPKFKQNDTERHTLEEITSGEQTVFFQFDKTDTTPKYHIVELLGDNRIGYVGEQKEKLDFLGESVIKVWFTDVDLGKRTIKKLGEGTPMKAGEQDVVVYTLDNGVKVLVSFPPDDSAMVVYLGLAQKYDKIQMGYDGKADTLQVNFQ